jgi:hypothetical protein
MTSRPGFSTLGLVADGALQLTLERPLCPLVERWVPRGLSEPVGAARATICVGASRTRLPRPAAAATLALGRVAAWVDDRRGTVVLRGGLPASGGVLSLGAGHARLGVDPADVPDARADLYSMLTVSAALLLAGLGRALVHAAAVVAPDGGAWLLAGDARSGKSTTCATLASAGWAFLSDDQVVLAIRQDGEDGVHVEGWLRPFHLDRIGERGEPTGERHEVAPAELGLAGWRRTARLAGVILPVVAAGEPTLLTPVPAAHALAGLVRQSPWLLACRNTAPAVLALLGRAVAGAFSLRLGRDTYRDPARLAACLGSLEARAAAC